jgi:hypothetical protein
LAAKKPKHKAKPTRGKRFGRNKVKCERYRRRVGKPAGAGVPGNKRGKNKRV